MAQIDGVGVDTIAGDDLEGRQPFHQISRCTELASGGDRPDTVAMCLEQAVEIGCLPKFVYDIACVETLHIQAGLGPIISTSGFVGMVLNPLSPLRGLGAVREAAIFTIRGRW